MTKGAAEDVESYVVARWSHLVRTLVELGASVPDAERVAAAACARTWGSWRRERRAGDVDVLVFGELLSRWSREPGQPPAGPDRVAAVLVAEARLSEHAAERLTGGDPGVAPPGARSSDDAYLGTAPIAAILDDVRRRRRRTTSLVAGAAVVVAVVAGLVLVLDAEPDRRPVVANALPLAWWSVGTLHLGRSEVAVPDLVELAQAGAGASYAVVFSDEGGDVHQVDDVSEPVRIGRTAPGSGISATLDGRAAWVDVEGQTPTVVVWDTAKGSELGRLPLGGATGPGTRVVALEDDTVYLDTPAGARRWTLGEAEPSLVGGPVVAAASDVLVVGAPTGGVPGGAPIVPGSSRFTVAADHGATLSADGLITAAWVPGEPDLTLIGAGANLTTVPLALPERTGIVAARFAPGGELVLVITDGPTVRDLDPGSDPGSAPVSVATCLLHTGTCDAVLTNVPPVVLER